MGLTLAPGKNQTTIETNNGRAAIYAAVERSSLMAYKNDSRISLALAILSLLRKYISKEMRVMAKNSSQKTKNLNKTTRFFSMGHKNKQLSRC